MTTLAIVAGAVGVVLAYAFIAILLGRLTIALGTQQHEDWEAWAVPLGIFWLLSVPATLILLVLIGIMMLLEKGMGIRR